MTSALQDLMKQAEAIPNIDTNLNLDHMSPSYKSMLIQKYITNGGQESCKRHVNKFKKERK